MLIILNIHFRRFARVCGTRRELDFAICIAFCLARPAIEVSRGQPVDRERESNHTNRNVLVCMHLGLSYVRVSMCE